MRRPRCRWIQKGLVWIFAATMVLPVGIQAADQPLGLGPLPVRNFQPIQMLVLGMFADRATVLNPGALDVRIELAETNSIFKEATNPPLFAMTRADMKFETLRAGVLLRYGLTSRLEVGLELPVLYRYRGFLEGAIVATERATTGVNAARNITKGLGYAFNVSREGRTLFEGGDGNLGLGDITLMSKYELLGRRDATPGVALRMALKLPTGDPDRTFGSGRTDVGIGLAMEQAIAQRWMFYGNANGVFPTGDVAGLDVRPTFSGLAAVEYLWSPKFSLIAQFEYYSSPFHGTGLKLLDRGITETAIGFNYKLRRNLLWQTYGVENLDFITGAAADFTLSTVMTYQFGR
jgi:hypothetical protein